MNRVSMDSEKKYFWFNKTLISFYYNLLKTGI